MLRRATRDQTIQCENLYRKRWSVEPPPGLVWWVLDGDPKMGACAARMDGWRVRLEHAHVHETRRGEGWQRRMVRVRLAWGRRQGATHGYSYTAAENVRSQRTLQACGFRVVWFRTTESGSWVGYECTL